MKGLKNKMKKPQDFFEGTRNLFTDLLWTGFGCSQVVFPCIHLWATEPKPSQMQELKHTANFNSFFNEYNA